MEAAGSEVVGVSNGRLEDLRECAAEVRPNRVNDLMSLLGATTDDDVAEIDLRIEELNQEIARLQRVRNILVPPPPVRYNVPDEPRHTNQGYVRKHPEMRLGRPVGSIKKKQQTRNTLTGFALIAHNKRVQIAKLMNDNPKRAWTTKEIASYTGLQAGSLHKTLKHEGFARISHDGINSVYALTDKGRELARES